MIGGSQWEHGGGFSIDAAVVITAADGAGRERLLRYCARPPFALQLLRELDAEHLLYERARSGPDGSGPLRLTPLPLLDRFAVLVLPLRTAVTAMALPVSTSPRPRCRSVRFRSFLRPLRVDRHVNNGSTGGQLPARLSPRRRLPECNCECEPNELRPGIVLLAQDLPI